MLRWRTDPCINRRSARYGRSWWARWATQASRKRKPAAPVGPLTWCCLERMTRFELATLTLATW